MERKAFKFLGVTSPHWVRTGVVVTAIGSVAAVVALFHSPDGRDGSTALSLKPSVASATTQQLRPTATSPTSNPLAASLGVVNVSAGDNNYSSGLFDTKINDVTKFQVSYENMDMAGGTPINGLSLKFRIKAAGTDEFLVTSTLSSTNLPAFNSSVVVDVPAGAHLSFIRGTAVWRHPDSSNKETDITVSDLIATTGVTLEDVPACDTYQCGGSVTFETRVVK